jgi:hypothetical protein
MLWQSFPKSDNSEYCCVTNLNLYDSSRCEKLATQAAKGRHLQIIAPAPDNHALKVRLCEDKYEAWLPLSELSSLEPAVKKYMAIAYNRSEIELKLASVVTFTAKAMEQPNYYLWGGTVPPNYDCSGLIQAAFASVGIWLPRDSYQQEVFTQRIAIDELQPGDLIFFGDKKVNHVALHLSDLDYIHSSGTEFGNNGIAINQLCDQGNQVNKNYYQQFWSCGRVIKSL